MTENEISSEIDRLTYLTEARLTKRMEREALDEASETRKLLSQLDPLFDALYFGDPIDDRMLRDAQLSVGRLHEHVRWMPARLGHTVSHSDFDRLRALSVDVRLEGITVGPGPT